MRPDEAIRYDFKSRDYRPLKMSATLHEAPDGTIHMTVGPGNYVAMTPQEMIEFATILTREAARLDRAARN